MTVLEAHCKLRLPGIFNMTLEPNAPLSPVTGEKAPLPDPQFFGASTPSVETQENGEAPTTNP